MESTTASAAAFHARAAHHHLVHLAELEHNLHGAPLAELHEMASRLAELAQSYLAIEQADRKLELVNRLGLSD